MADPRFQGEKQGAVSPEARGTGTGKFNNAKPAAPPAGADPFKAPPYNELQLRNGADCRHLEDIVAERSPTFRKHLAKLKKRGATVRYDVDRLPVEAGGGRTYPSPDRLQYLILIDPATLAPGYHLVDVFLHEHGHVAEYDRVKFERAKEGKYYLEFMHAVQRELGLRETPDSHKDETK